MSIYPSIPDGCLAATWHWQQRWLQTVRVVYGLVVAAPRSVAAWGMQIDERSASWDQEAEYADWGQDGAAGWPGTPTLLAAGSGSLESEYRYVAIDADAEEAIILSALAEADARIAREHMQQIEVPCLPSAVADIDLHHTVALAGLRTILGGTITAGLCTLAAIEAYLDLSNSDAETLLVARVSRCPGAAGTSDALVAPSRPAITEGYTLPLTVSFPTHIGGRTGAATYDESAGVWTNWWNDIDPGAPVYEYRAHFTRPEIPAAARDGLEVGGVATYNVYLPHGELVEVAP